MGRNVVRFTNYTPKYVNSLNKTGVELPTSLLVHTLVKIKGRLVNLPNN